MKKLTIVLSLLLLSCQGKDGYKQLKYRTQEMPTPATDVRLPTKLWNLFENPNGEAKAETEAQKPTAFMALNVYLYERNRGILGSENHLLVYPAGGGELDLKDYVTDKSGSFYFVAEPRTKIEKPNLKVYFLSNSTGREIDGTEVGSGCDSYFEVTSAFAKAAKGEGFLLNTTAQRHVSAVAGTYFFVIDDGQKLQLSRLTVKDSRYPAVQCKR